MDNPYNKIIQLLDEKKIEYEVFEHEPVYTSEQAAQVRGGSLSEGAKSLLLKADDKFILAVLPGDKKLDSKKLKDYLKVKKLRFAFPKEVKEVMGCEIGACYSLGNLIVVQTIVDKSLAKNKIISFNPGVHDKTIKLKYWDYQKIVNPTVINLIK